MEHMISHASKSVIVFALFQLCAGPLFSQDTCSSILSGHVTDEHDGQPLPFASIYIREAALGTVSDTAGFYRIEGLCDGEYTLVCTHVGCQPVTATVVVAGHTVHDFHPEHHAELLREVNIVGKTATEEPVYNAETLHSRELRENQGKPLAESLSEINGVTTLTTGNSIAKPVIHGLHSNRVLILNNEVRQEGQQWGNEHAPEIDPFIADELIVIKGANSVRYGPDAIAGVILVNPKPLRDSAGMSGELNLVGASNGRQGTASAMVEGNMPKLGGLSWRAQGTYKRAGNIHAPGYFLKNTGLREYNFSWAAGYLRTGYGIEVFYSQFNTDLGIFSGSHIGNLTDLQRAFEAEQPLDSSGFSYTIGSPSQHIEHELFKAKVYIGTGTRGKLSLTYARQYNKRLEYDKHSSPGNTLTAPDVPALQFEITTHSADLAWEHAIGSNVKGLLGYSGLLQGNTYEGRFFIPNFQKRVAGIFWIERWNPDGSRFTLEAGTRGDYVFQEVFIREGTEILSPAFTYIKPSGNAGILYRGGERWLFRANGGTAWRPPNVNEMFSNGLHHGAAAVEIGDTSLVPEVAYSASVEAEYTGRKLYARIDMYYNYIDHFIYLEPVLPPTLTIRGAFPTFRFAQVNATLQGIDATLRYAFSEAFSWTGKVSTLHAWNRSEGEYIVQMPADRMENTVEYHLPDHKNLKDVYSSLTVLGVREQKRVPPDSDFAPPPGAYFLINLQVGFSFPLKQQDVSAGIGINNLLNTSYRDYLNRFRYYTDNMGRNISLRLSIPFTTAN